MSRLSDAQLIILSGAARRPDGAVLPTPRKLTVQPRPVLQRLLKAGLVAEAPASPEAKPWRETETGERLTLVLTDAGREAIGVEVQPSGRTAPPGHQKARGGARGGAASAGAPSADKSPRASRETKQGLLIALLSRSEGATIAEAVEATGWQSHSVRGAISGSLKKKLGLAVVTAVETGRGRVYRIVDPG